MEQIQWEHIEYLRLLALLPLLGIFYFVNRFWRRKVFRRWGEWNLLNLLIPDYATQKRGFKFILLMLAFSFLVLSVVNPRVGTKQKKAKIKGVDLFVAIDVSKSMLSEDLKPNRLERSRLFTSRLLDKMANNRVGLIIFAGHAYLQMPLSSDHSAAKMFLKSIGPDMVPTQGTAIAEAINLAIKSFDQDKVKDKAILIISDGEDHESGVLEAAQKAADNGILIETIGVGTDRGAPIPIYNNGYLQGYKKDADGNVVMSKLNQAALSQIALSGDGQYQKPEWFE